MVKITKDGIIEGGNCDRAHRARASREVGAKIFLAQLFDKGCISSNNGWCKIIKIPTTSERKIYQIGGDKEIGYRRFRGETFELYRKKKSFRMAWLKKLLEAVCGCEWGLLKLKNPKAPPVRENLIVNPGYAPPWGDDIYKKRKQRGEFNT